MSDTRREIIKTALDNIRMNPETWRQNSWRCGTACCFAGHVALAAGWKWREPSDDDGGDYVVGPNGEVMDVATVAAAIVTGCSPDEARNRFLEPAEFDPDNTLADIESGLRERGLL